MKPSQRLRLKKILAHGFLLVALALVVLPFLMVLVASLRKGNFPPNSLWLNPDQWSLEHWKYVLNIPYSEIVNPSTGETRMVQPPTPPLHWLWNSVIVSAVSSARMIFVFRKSILTFVRMPIKLHSPDL